MPTLQSKTFNSPFTCHGEAFSLLTDREHDQLRLTVGPGPAYLFPAPVTLSIALSPNGTVTITDTPPAGETGHWEKLQNISFPDFGLVGLENEKHRCPILVLAGVSTDPEMSLFPGIREPARVIVTFSSPGTITVAVKGKPHVSHPRRWHFTPKERVWANLPQGRGITTSGKPLQVASKEVPSKENDRLIAFLKILPPDVTDVFLVGSPSFKDLYQWVNTQDPSGEYALAYEDCFFPTGDPTSAVLVYKRMCSDHKTRVRVRFAAPWFATDDPQAACRAMELVDQVLKQAFGLSEKHTGWLASPAATGRLLWQDDLGAKGRERTWPVLGEELQALLRATAGQGRIELRVPPAVPETLPGLVCVDQRWAYAPLAQKVLPVGPAVFEGPLAWDHYSAQTREGTTLRYRQARYQVRGTVPQDWNHLGLVPVPYTANGQKKWYYPASPGETFTTWLDSAELFLAYQHGWRFEITEQILFAPAKDPKPLARWARKLVDAQKTIPSLAREHDYDAGVAQLASRALRSVLLQGIGAFQGRERPVTVFAATPADFSGPIEPGSLTQVGGQLWKTTLLQPPAAPDLAHPEWAGRIWALCRCSLLQGPRTYPYGAFSLPPEQIVGCHTDSLYLTTPPDWPDDGENGRYREKGRIERSLSAPTSLNELFGLTTEIP